MVCVQCGLHAAADAAAAEAWACVLQSCKCGAQSCKSIYEASLSRARPALGASDQSGFRTTMMRNNLDTDLPFRTSPERMSAARSSISVHMMLPSFCTFSFSALLALRSSARACAQTHHSACSPDW